MAAYDAGAVRLLDLSRLENLRDRIQSDYKLLSPPSSDHLGGSPHAEHAVVGYIWPCLPNVDCLWPWSPRRNRNAAKGLARAQEVRERTVSERDLQLVRRWEGDAGALEMSVATLGGQVWSLRVGEGATAGQVSARLAALARIPEPEIALVCDGVRIAGEDPVPREKLEGPGPHAFMLRVRRRRALSGAHDSSLRLWDVTAGTCIGTMRGHGDAILSLTVDWASRRALTGSHDCRLKLWDLDHCLCVATFQSPGHPAFCLAADWPAGRAASGSWDNALKVWDLETGESPSTLRGHAGPILCVALDWGSQRALSGAQDGAVKMWDLQTEAERWTATGHLHKVTALAVDWRSQRAVSGDGDGTLRLWAWDGVAGPECLATMVDHQRAISGVFLDWPSRHARSSSWDGTVRTWDLQRGACVATLQQEQGAVTCMAVDWAAACAVTGSSAKSLRLWDVEAGEAMETLVGHEDTISCVAIEPADAPAE